MQSMQAQARPKSSPRARAPTVYGMGVFFFLSDAKSSFTPGVARTAPRRPRMFSDIRQLSELFKLQKPEMGTEYGFYQARLFLRPRACALLPRALRDRVVLHLRWWCSPLPQHRLRAFCWSGLCGAR